MQVRCSPTKVRSRPFASCATHMCTLRDPLIDRFCASLLGKIRRLLPATGSARHRSASCGLIILLSALRPLGSANAQVGWSPTSVALST